MSEIEEFIENEISFHREHVEPWYWVMLHKMFRKRMASEVVVNELEMILRYIKLRRGNLDEETERDI